jgi:hypothetical protein
MDEGPVLVFIFNAQQTHCVRDRTGAIVDGSEVGTPGSLPLPSHIHAYIISILWSLSHQDNVRQTTYMFAMRRNPAIFDPVHAWQVLEMNILNSTAVW